MNFDIILRVVKQQSSFDGLLNPYVEFMRNPPNTYEARLNSAWHTITSRVMRERDRERQLAYEKSECDQSLKMLFDRRKSIVARITDIDKSYQDKIQSIEDFLAEFSNENDGDHDNNDDTDGSDLDEKGNSNGDAP